MIVPFNGWYSKHFGLVLFDNGSGLFILQKEWILMAKVFCFSSTGNSLYTAKKISQAIDAELISMTADVTKCDDDVIGFVFPCYFWHLPLRVESFINNLEIINKNAYVFAVVTFGGTIMCIPGIVKKLLAKKSVKLSYGMKIRSVENYNISYKVNDNAEIHENAERIINTIINDIKVRKTNYSSSPFFMNSIIRSSFPALKSDCDSKFTISDNCNGCGICEKICPVSNIKITDGKPAFSGKCEHCLGCIHACPKQAVNWDGKTEGKQRYLNPNIKLKELMDFNSQR